LVVVHVLAPGTVGGLERVVHGLAVGHRLRGHDVHVAAVVDSRGGDHPFLTPLEAHGVTVHCCEIVRRGYFRERRFVRDLLRAHPSAVMHTHGHRPTILDVGVARRLGVPTVTTVHGASKVGWKSDVYELLLRRAYRQFDAVVAVSRPLGESLARHGVARHRVHTIPNAWPGGIDFLDRAEARRRLGLPPGAFVVGWIGRMIPVKNCGLVLQALGDLGELPWHGVLIGDGPERPQLEAAARAAGLSSRLLFAGQRDDAPALLRAFDVFVLSSKSEGTPMVLLEAMAAGVPIVSSRVGGIPDVIGEPEALLFPPDSSNALTQAIRDVHREQAAASQRAEAARRRLDDSYGVETWLRRYEAVYRSSRTQPPPASSVSSPSPRDGR
jgi:glycosyltransferase involved in cell wall biosynthesis